ncbi:MAG: NUDIX domain-containing protein [Candidatus Pacearchaeota archaeon]
MKYRKGIRLVVYKKEKNRILYLVLKRKLRWKGYELIKGGKKEKENDLQAIKRELKEETNLTPLKIKKLNLIDKFIYPDKYKKIFKKNGFIARCYLVEVGSKKIKLSKEHSSYKWLPYIKAKNILSYDNAKKILKIANKILK